MKKKIDDPKQIVQIMQQIRMHKQSAMRSPFTGMLVLFCYTLWKDYKYSQAKLAKFTQDFALYEKAWLKKDYKELEDRLFSYAEWKVEYEPVTENDFPKYQSVVLKKFIDNEIKSQNEINELSARYLTYGFSIMIDYGVKKRQLTNIKDKMNDRLNYISREDSDIKIMDLWTELVEKAGIYIERPMID